MATLTPTLTLTSDVFSSNSISLSTTGSFTVVAPSQDISTEIVTNTGNNHVIKPAATATAYLYVKHTSTTNGTTGNTTDSVDIQLSDDNSAFCRLGPGDFCFIPFSHAGVSNGVELQTTSNEVLCEYMWFTKA